MPKKIVVEEAHFYNEATEEFIDTPKTTLILEHSLISISKWEAKWHKAYLDENRTKTFEEALDYIKCMCITNNVNDNVFLALTENNIKDITEYLNDPMTATTINSYDDSSSKDVVTSELIYYWMDCYKINWEAQKWPLNRLIMLIRVHQVKSEKPKKMTPAQIMKRNAELNAKRRAALGSKG